MWTSGGNVVVLDDADLIFLMQALIDRYTLDALSQV
jgi:hypothetical protein